MFILCGKTNVDLNLPTEVCVIVHTDPPVRDVNNEEKMLIKDRMKKKTQFEEKLLISILNT